MALSCPLLHKGADIIDKHIKMLMIKLSAVYRVLLMHIMSFDSDNQRFTNSFELSIYEKPHKKGQRPVYKTTLHSKRDVVSELMRWLNV